LRLGKFHAVLARERFELNTDALADRPVIGNILRERLRSFAFVGRHLYADP
jgi:hypothetical protein